MQYRISFSILFACCLLQQAILYGQNIRHIREERKSGYKGNFNKHIRVPRQAFSFIALGDWGRNGDYAQRDVARQMSRVAATADIRFITAVGDNFYPNGVRSVDDPQWQSSFEQIYRGHFLHCDWLVALGNHDYKGNIEAQIAYSGISRRWQLPAPYYSKTFNLNDTDQLLLVVMDTNPFIDAYYKKNDELGANVRRQDTAAQRRWLEATLAQAGAAVKWKIVVGHHPLYSGGKRSNSPDTEAMRLKFQDLFDRMRVDAYVCGHEHDLQLIRPEGHYTSQLLSGAGCEVRPTGRTNGSLFAASEPGFMLCVLRPRQFEVQVINARGKILYRYLLQH